MAPRIWPSNWPGSCEAELAEVDAELLAESDDALGGGGGPGGPAGTVPSPLRLLINDARSAESPELLLLAVVVALSDAVVSAVLAVLAELPVDCRFTRNDCKSAINWDAEAASLEELELAEALLSDAAFVASGGGPGGRARRRGELRRARCRTGT